MPNRFTAVPNAPPPAITGPARWLLPFADTAMIALASRPAGGSLRASWVTPATLWLSLASAVLAAIAAVFVAASGNATWLRLAGATACIVIVFGALCIALVGWRQRAMYKRQLAAPRVSGDAR